MTLRRAAAAVLLVSLAACKTGGVHAAVDGLAASIRDLLGSETLPGQYVDQIASVHESETTWRFRADAEQPLEKTCGAVRLLATAHYGSWREFAIVTRLLSAMAASHPSALVRAECLDAMTTMYATTTSAAVAMPSRATPGDVETALRRIADARKDESRSAESAAAVAAALDTLASFRFDTFRELPERVELPVLARGAREQLVTTGKVLRALTGGVLEGYDADPRVRDAADRALVATCASSIRLALLAAASAAGEPMVRETAVRDLERARPDGAGRILSAVLVGDSQSAVRAEAARSLGKFPSADGFQALVAALADDRFDVRSVAAASLQAVTGESFGDDRRAWLRWWRERGAAPGTAPTPPGTDAR